MPDITAKLESLLAERRADAEVLKDAIEEIRELRKRRDELEEILILLARTNFPFDDDGRATEEFPHFRERYLNAMHEATRLLGLDVRSTITRTEPRT
jgi:hypothetical protein